MERGWRGGGRGGSEEGAGGESEKGSCKKSREDITGASLSHLLLIRHSVSLFQPRAPREITAHAYWVNTVIFPCMVIVRRYTFSG